MRILRATAIFDHDNGLPRDQVQSTFHFRDTDEDGDPAALAGIVADFYASPIAGEGRAIGAWLSPLYNNVQVKVYEVNDYIDGDDRLRSIAGPPIYTSGLVDLGLRSSSIAWPAEVAVCLSYRDTTFPMIPKAQRTGRVYVGPFNDAAGITTANTIQRPDPQLLSDLRTVAPRMQDASVALGLPWVVYSRPFGGRPETPRPGRPSLPALPARPASVYAVDQIWTDDAFDTQRRRGERATAKTVVAV